jgi:serine/threonine-protein kinase
VVLYIGAQLLAALDYAHALMVEGEHLHIVHRDISPSNILVSQYGEVKLTDFGIAKSRSRKHRTQTGHTKGKIAYMSPEQVRGEELDARSDLFAVGVVLFELLTGEHPFYAPADLTLLNNILNGTRKSLRELVPELEDAVVAVVDALLSPDRERRPKNAGEALKVLPMREQPFVVQRELAKLVVDYRASKPTREGSLRPTPQQTPIVAQVSDGATAILPAGKTPVDRAAVRANSTTKDLLTPPPKRRRSGLLVAVGLGGVLSLATVAWLAIGGGDDATVAPPPDIPALPAAKAPDDPTEATAPSTPTALAPSSASKVEDPADAAVPPATAPEPQETSTRERRASAQREGERSSHSRHSSRDKNDSERERPDRATRPSGRPARSGATISPDEF